MLRTLAGSIKSSKVLFPDYKNYLSEVVKLTDHWKKMMKAIVIHEPGGPEVLKIEEVGTYIQAETETRKKKKEKSKIPNTIPPPLK